MTSTPAVLYRGMLPETGAPAVVTVPESTRWVVSNLVLVNTASYSYASVAVSVDLDGVALLSRVLLDPGTTLVVDGCAQVLDAGRSISLSADVAGRVAAHVSGVAFALGGDA